MVGVGIAAACSSFEEGDGTAPRDGGALAPDSGDGIDAGGDAAEPGDANNEAKQHLYVFGGVKNTQATAVTPAYRAPIASDGSLGPWEPVPSLDLARAGAAAIVTALDRVVLAGGITGALGAETLDTSTDTVVTAGMRDNGGWSPAAPLGAVRMTPAGTLAVKRIYVSGGLHPDDTLHDEVWLSTFENGALAPWTAAGTLPQPRATHATVAIGTRFYVVGGTVSADGGGLTATASTMMGAIGTDGSLSGWTDAGTLPLAVRGHAVVTVGLRAIAIGGADSSDVPRAEVSVGSQAESGVLQWVASTPLPSPAYGPCAVASGNDVYVVGGIATPGGDAQPTVVIGRVAPSGGVSWTAAPSLPGGRAAAGCAIR